MTSNILIKFSANKLSFINGYLITSNQLKILPNIHNRYMSSNVKYRTHTSAKLDQTIIKNTPKRTINKQILDHDSNACWSVIAYNLSEELKIDNAHRLLENFKEYKINKLPQDLHDEAIMLSIKKDINDNNIDSSDNNICDKPLHDIFLFREGSIVFWGVPYDQQKRILYGLSPLKIDPYKSDLIQEEREHLIYNIVKSREKSKMNRDVVELSVDQDQNSLLLDQFAFSHAVALSVKLGIWEAILDQYIESIGWVTNSMKLGKGLRLNKDQVFRKTGELYELRHNINLSSDLLDLPDIYWDRHNQEIIFLSMASFLNIRKRTAVMNEKLNNCCELMNLLAGHMNDRNHIRLEWMIIVLITVEVLFEVARFF